MDLGRKPVYEDNSFCREIFANGSQDKLDERNNSHKSVNAQLLKQGNGCNHDKNNFRRPDFTGNGKRRPHVIEEAKRRIEQAVSDIFMFSEFTRVFYHPLKNERGRRRRSESVEGTFCLALPMLIHGLNLSRMECGFYKNDNEFHSYDYAYLVNKTNQNYSRIKREMKLLQELGIIKVISTREKTADGAWRTKNVRIEFTDRIFQMLELMDEYLRDRETSDKMFHGKQSRLETERKRLERFRKPYFKSKPYQAKGLQSLPEKLTKRPAMVVKGQGLEIREQLNDLVRKGMSVPQAIEALKKLKPPPS